jgi:hypothetical protein
MMAYFFVLTIGIIISCFTLDLKAMTTTPFAVFSTVVGVLIFGAAWFGDRGQAKLHQKHGLICDACGKPLMRLSGQRLLRTGRCERCDAKVVSGDT